MEHWAVSHHRPVRPRYVYNRRTSYDLRSDVPRHQHHERHSKRKTDAGRYRGFDNAQIRLVSGLSTEPCRHGPSPDSGAMHPSDCPVSPARRPTMRMSREYWIGDGTSMTIRRMQLYTLMLMALLAGCGGQGLSQSPASTDKTIPALTLDTAIHFATPDGAPLLVEPDDYRVEQATESQLRLVPEKGGRPVLLAAEITTHDIEVSKPFPLLLALNEDARNLVLLLPDGAALDAAGSLSGIQSRDLARPRRHYHLAYQLDQATGQIRFGDGVTGQRPPGSQSQVASTYHGGTGAIGNIDATRNSELEMINLQSLVSQRQQAVSLAQNIAAAQNEPFHFEYNMNRPGNDYGQRTTVSPEACRAICSTDSACQAFTFVKPPAGSTAGQCYLKRSVPTAAANPCCISAKRKSAQEELVGNIGR